MKLKPALWMALATLLVLALCLRSVDSRQFGIAVYAHTSYYLILALFLTWTATVFNYLSRSGFSASQFGRKNAAPLAASVLVTAIVFNSVEPRWRVLSDESNLISVSQAMLFDKTVYNHTMNKRYYGALWPLSSVIEKRPLMFPFLVHLVHLVRGYHAENAYVVNAIALFGLLAAVGVSVTSFLGSAPGVASVLLIAAYPLVTMQATSAGFDLMSTFFVFLLLILLYCFFKAPSAGTFGLLWVHFLVFVNIRYESVAIGSIIVGSIFLLREFRLSYVMDRPLVFILTPFLVLPMLIQRVLVLVPTEARSGTPFFSLRHFQANVASLVAGQQDFGNVTPHAPLMTLSFVLILFGVVIHGARGKLPPVSLALGRTLVVGAFAVLSSLLIVLWYYGGGYRHPASARLFLTPAVVSSLGLIFAHAAAPRLLGRPALLLASLTFFIYYHPTSIQSRFTSRLVLVRETEVINDFLDGQDQKTLLMISSRPGQIAARNIGSVNFGYANRNRDALLAELRRRLFSDIFVAQEVSYADLEPIPADRLHADFELETLVELQANADHFMRISRVGRPPMTPEGSPTPTPIPPS